MAKTRIKWNNKGFQALRKDRGIMSDLIDRAQAIAEAAGPGYETSPFTGRNRARVSVITGDAAARKDNAERNTLLRAIDAGR